MAVRSVCSTLRPCSHAPLRCRPPTCAASSYNAVNGVPSCANNWLLGTLLRDAWGFDGTVVSDCDADSDV